MKMKRVKAIVALALVMVMLFGIVPPIKSEASTPLTPGKSMSTAKNVPKYFREYYGYWDKETWDYQGQSWYKFKTDGKDAFYTIDIKALSADRIYAVLMEASEEKVCETGEIRIDQSTSINKKLKKNTWYYLGFKCSVGWNSSCTSGNVRIKISWRKDSEPDTKSKATKVVAGKKYVGRVDGVKSNDSDWYKFTAPTTDTYVVSLKNVDCAKRIRLAVYTSNLTSQDENDGIKKNKTYNASVKMKKGKTYYIRVKGTTAVGRYSFTVKKK